LFLVLVLTPGSLSGPGPDFRLLSGPGPGPGSSPVFGPVPGSGPFLVLLPVQVLFLYLVLISGPSSGLVHGPMSGLFLVQLPVQVMFLVLNCGKDLWKPQIGPRHAWNDSSSDIVMHGKP
jgi:hypothetical protein